MRFLALITLCLFALLAFTQADEPVEFCACPRNLSPVCGSDGITYPNGCELDCSAEKAARNGGILYQYKDGNC